MVHVFSEFGFAFVAAASASLIWVMLSANRAAITAALGLHDATPLPRVAEHRIRVRSVQPAMSFQHVAARTGQARRVA